MTTSPPDPDSDIEKSGSEENDSLDYDRNLARRVELAKFGYAEVLDATKHHDDKIGRFLTSIAFLTTGAIAFGFGIQGGLLYVNYRIGNRSVPLPSVSLLMFLLFVLLTVLILVSAMGPTLRIPGQEPRKEFDRVSNMYFIRIATMNADDWANQWGLNGKHDVTEMEQSFRDHLLYETHNLATRVAFKYERMREARSSFSMSLCFLAFTFLLMLYVPISGNQTAKRPVQIPWSWHLDVVSGFVTAMFTFYACYDLYRFDQSAHGLQEGWPKRRRFLVALMITSPLTAISSQLVTSCGTRVAELWATIGVTLVLALATYTIATALYKSQSKRDKKQERTLRILKKIPSICFAAYFLFTYIIWEVFGDSGIEVSMFFGSLLPILSLQLLNLRRSAFKPDPSK